MTATETETTWTQNKTSKLSSSYWICDQDETQHVYKMGRKWIRATVVNGLARSSSKHSSRTAAMNS
jgi:hypothetical protein